MIRLNRIICMFCLIVLLGVATLCCGVTYARYSSSVQQSLNFQVKTVGETGAFRLSSAKGWQVSDGGMTLDFMILPDGAIESPCTVCLRLTATEGLNDDVVIALTVDGKTYTATAETIQTDDPLYAQMGGGTQFRFIDTDGEVSWSLTAEKAMRLSVQGASDEALLRLVVGEI